MSSWYNPSSWFSNIYYRMVGKNHVYSLTNTGLGEFSSCFNGGYSEANLMMMFESVPEFFAVVDAIASRVKNGQYKLVNAKTGEEIADNALWNKISITPNWQFTFKEFIYHAIVYKYVTGNVYGFTFIPSTMAVKHANIQAVWLLPSHYTKPFLLSQRPSYLTTLSANEYINYYEYTGDGKLQNIKPELVTHDIFLKVGDSTDIVTGRGITPFKAAEYPLSNLVAVYKARNVIYVKRGALGFIVSRKSDASGQQALTKTEKEDLRKDYQESYGFGEGQSPVAITNQPVDFIKVGSTIKDMEPFEETLASTAALAGIAGVPMALIPKTQESKFANLDIAERNFYDNKIIPESEAICHFLTRLGHFEEIGAKVVVSFDEIKAMQDDELKEAQAYNANVQAATQLYDDGHITRNQLLVKIGEEPIEGGDDYITQEERLDRTAGQPSIPNPKTEANIDAQVDPEEQDETEKTSIMKTAKKLFKNKK